VPYPNEHSCRIRQPGEFKPESFRRIKSGKVELIIGKLKEKSTTILQAIRYSTADWPVEKARADCKDRGGSFEAAKED
jgi:hypothetical protein